jgi:hypothetical protein
MNHLEEQKSYREAMKSAGADVIRPPTPMFPRINTIYGLLSETADAVHRLESRLSIVLGDERSNNKPLSESVPPNCPLDGQMFEAEARIGSLLERVESIERRLALP